MGSRDAIGDRAPGGLPELLQRVSRLAEAEGKSKALLAPVVAVLREMAAEQDRFNRRMWDGFLGLPARHRQTHMGGVDTVETTLLPTPITLGAAGAVGTPSVGYSPGDHEHPTTDLDFLLDLTGLAVGPDGIPVADIRARRLLEAILLELSMLSEVLGVSRQ